MPREDGQFKGEGKGIKHGQKPVCVKFPAETDAILRGLPDLSGYVRNAVIEQLRKDGYL